MKTRVCFVSNSSSSSCVVIARKAASVSDSKYGYPISVWGKQIGDGVDFFPVTPEIKKVIESTFVIGHIVFYETFKIMSEDWQEGTPFPRNVPNEFRVFSIEIDMHITRDASEFMERYIY